MLLSLGRTYAQEPLNLASPEKHSYIEIEGNRDVHAFTDAEVNEGRVYDFYQRQADYYMKQESFPEILPAFPGLDAGLHGHWGLHSENDGEDGRWNNIEMGPVWRQSVRYEQLNFGKGVSAHLGEAGSMGISFDPLSLSYRCVWEGGFINFDPWRWGTSRNALPDGDMWFTDNDPSLAWTVESKEANYTYHGYYRFEDRIIFSYEVNGKQVLDSPWSTMQNGKPILLRTLHFPDGFSGGRHRLGTIPKNKVVVTHFKKVAVNIENGIYWLDLPKLPPESRIGIAIGNTGFVKDTHANDAADAPLSEFLNGGNIQWPQSITLKGSLAAKNNNGAYVLDTIPVPFDNPFKSVMQLSGIAFLKDGSALVSSLTGEVWKVTGLDESLRKVTWKRFATGLNQPMGIHIDDDGVFVMERGQITRLLDLNRDGEADFYENWANDFDGRDKSHSHSFGLVRAQDGAFYFVNWKDVYRTGSDRKTDLFAYGVRNCMGVGIDAQGRVLVGPQEGTDTPASMVIEVQQGEFYGHPGDGPVSTIAAPLCFIPRGIDNSTGGFIAATSEQWGPLNNHTIGLSYGYSTHYLVLRDDSTSVPQGATVPLDGDFSSGIMRGAFSPKDGQLYTVGMDGWGDYSVTDGCLQRVRYTGQPFRKPIGFQVHSNGIRIDFTILLDKSISTDPNNFFVQQWDYEYAKRYGSPEFSHRTPDSLGHDPVKVRSVVLLNSGKSLFLEMPDIEPVMQMHIRMHGAESDGKTFKTDLFPSILQLGKHFDAPGIITAVEHKHSTIHLRIDNPTSSSIVTESGSFIEGERTIVLKAGNTLQFDLNLIEATAGEAIKLIFENPDIMPHNVVFVTEGNLKKVGDLSFSMLNDPKAADKHYTPEVPEVIANTFIVQPGGKHTLHFQAPKEPGDHHFVCTFPGHWLTMNGAFRVTKE